MEMERGQRFIKERGIKVKGGLSRNDIRKKKRKVIAKVRREGKKERGVLV